MEFEIGKTSKKYGSRQRAPQHDPDAGVALGKQQPQDLELEETVLGALMLEDNAFVEVAEFLKPECFYDPRNQLIYRAIQELNTAQKPIDMLTVTEQLRTDGTLDDAGGAVRVSELTGRVSSAANVEYHARIVLQKYLARELISYSSQIGTLAFDESIDVWDLMQEAEASLFQLSQNTMKRDVQQIDPIVTAALKKMEEASKRESGLSGLRTGFDDLDKKTSGWQNSDLIIIAARPAMGKTAMVLSMAKNMAVDYSIPIAVFSLEMSNLQLVNRLISNVCSIEGEKIKNGQLSPAEWEHLMESVKVLYSAPLYVDDTPSLSVFELRSKARRLVREHGVKCIIIDYLQLMNASGMKFGSREQEVSTISRNLKQLAKELDIPIIALSQLNRSVEQRGDDRNGKRPQLSDLRESGAIEQDADIVCFIHREQYYLKSTVDAEGNNIDGKAEFIIAKHRSGSIGTVNMHFEARYARFENENRSLLPAAGGEATYESKMNNGGAVPPAPADNMPPDMGPLPPPPNTDFLTSAPGEVQAPF